MVCVLCNSTALQKFLRFLPTIALQRFYLPGLETLTCLSTKHHHYIIFPADWIVAFVTVKNGGQRRLGQNAGMGSAGRGGFRRRNGGSGAAAGARRRALRTQSVGSAAAEKVAGEEKRRKQGLLLLGSVSDGRG